MLSRKSHSERLFCSLNKLLLFTSGVFTPRIWLHTGPRIVNSVQECNIAILFWISVFDAHILNFRATELSAN